MPQVETLKHGIARNFRKGRYVLTDEIAKVRVLVEFHHMIVDRDILRQLFVLAFYHLFVKCQL